MRIKWGQTRRPWLHRMGVLTAKRKQKPISFSWPRGDMRKQLSVSQEESSPRIESASNLILDFPSPGLWAIHFYCESHPVCGRSLWQPELTSGDLPWVKKNQGFRLGWEEHLTKEQVNALCRVFVPLPFACLFVSSEEEPPIWSEKRLLSEGQAASVWLAHIPLQDFSCSVEFRGFWPLISRHVCLFFTSSSDTCPCLLGLAAMTACLFPIPLPDLLKELRVRWIYRSCDIGNGWKSQCLWTPLLFELWCQIHFYLPSGSIVKCSRKKKQCLFLLIRVTADKIAGWQLKESQQTHKARSRWRNRRTLWIRLSGAHMTQRVRSGA